MRGASYVHTDYAVLYNWSVTDLEGFWSAV
jgi:hypothetical protein